jgi:hypothetical protein
MVRESYLINEDILAKVSKKAIKAAYGSDKLAKGYEFLINQCGKADVELFGGRVREFLWIEVFVFTFFMLTMLILMIKSRFMPVGVDNSG